MSKPNKISTDLKFPPPVLAVTQVWMKIIKDKKTFSTIRIITILILFKENLILNYTNKMFKEYPCKYNQEKYNSIMFLKIEKKKKLAFLIINFMI